jgi:hypothetical protein
MKSSLGQSTARLWPASTGASFSGEDMEPKDYQWSPEPASTTGYELALGVAAVCCIIGLMGIGYGLIKLWAVL